MESSRPTWLHRGLSQKQNSQAPRAHACNLTTRESEIRKIEVRSQLGHPTLDLEELLSIARIGRDCLEIQEGPEVIQPLPHFIHGLYKPSPFL
jgi:hypothetical protein